MIPTNDHKPNYIPGTIVRTERPKGLVYDTAKLGPNLKKWREKIGFTQTELAELIDCDKSHIRHIENGDYKVKLDSADSAVHLSLGLFVRIVNTLECSVEELLCY